MDNRSNKHPLPSLLNQHKLMIYFSIIFLTTIFCFSVFYVIQRDSRQNQALEAESYFLSIENVCDNHVRPIAEICSILKDESVIRDKLNSINLGKEKVPDTGIEIDGIISTPQTYRNFFRNYSINAITIYFQNQLIYYSLSDKTVDNALTRTTSIYQTERDIPHTIGEYIFNDNNAAPYAYWVQDYYNIYNGRYYGKIIIEINPIPSNKANNNPYYMVPTSHSLDLQLYPSTVYYLYGQNHRIVFSSLSESVGQDITGFIDEDVLNDSASIHITKNNIYSNKLIDQGRLKLMISLDRSDLSYPVPIAFILLVSSCIIIYILIHIIIYSRYSGALNKLEDFALIATLQANPIQPDAVAKYKETQDVFSAFAHYCNCYDMLNTKYTELRENQTKSQLNTLNEQIDPHFLFNILDIISWKAIQSNSDDVSSMIKYLSNILRFQIQHDESKISLRQEVNYIYQYLGLQKLSDSINFNYSIVADNDLLDKYYIPKLTLQPLVENSIRHGFKNLDRPGEIRVDIWEDIDGIICRVCDNGNGFTPCTLQHSDSDGNGVALINIKKRLELLYGDPYTLSIESTPGAGTIATVYIPYDPISTEVNYNV